MSHRRLRIALLTVTLATLMGAAGPPDAPVADAAMRGDVEAVRSLVRAGADVNASQGDGMTALHWAADRGDVVMTGVLLEAGSNVDAGTRIGRYTPLHIATRQGRRGVVEALLGAGADPLARTTNSGATPLHLASAAGDTDIVSSLLSAGADPDVTEGAWDQTPLIFAAANNRAEAVRVLLAAGADPDKTARAIDVPEQAEADQAAGARLTSALEKFRESEGGGIGWVPSSAQVQAAIQLSRQVQRRWPDVPLETEEADAEAEDEAEEPPVDNAVDEESPGGEQNGDEAEPEKPDAPSYADLVHGWGGLAPLHHAARQGHADAVLALLESGADIDLLSGGDATTPLLIAAINGQFDVAMLLLERGADPRIANHAGTTPLYAVIDREWAPKASYAHPVEHQQQGVTYLDAMEALLDAGANPNARLETHLWYMEFTFSRIGIDTRGATPFFRAAHALDLPAMELLVRYGADPNIPTRKPPGDVQWGAQVPENVEDMSGLPPVPADGPGVYPLHAASGYGGVRHAVHLNARRHVPGGWLPAVEYLVDELGADINIRDYLGFNAVHHAASRGDDEMIRFLVSRGADPTAAARSGQTPVDVANGPVSLGAAPFPTTIELLQSLGGKGNYSCAYC